MVKEKDINKLLEQVIDDVAGILAKSEQPLKKADPGEETPGEAKPSGSSSEGSGSSSASPAPTPSAAKEGDADDAGTPAPDASASADPGQDPNAVDQGGDDIGAIKAEYAKEPLERLKMLFVACHAALMEKMGGVDDQSAQAPQAPAPEATPGEGSPPGPGEQSSAVTKKEFCAGEGSGGEMTSGAPMKKSETEIKFEERLVALEKSIKDKDAVIAEKDKTLADLESRFGEAAAKMTTFLQKHTGVGLRKSIAGVNEVSFEGKPGTDNKTTEISFEEAKAKLNEISRQPDLKKSDREAITSYVLGAAQQSTVAHLLNK
jgi:hypothetical protein